jgi:UDP-N-acetylglucosamine 2-epimerase
MHILTIIGARPQFIKAAVLSRYIRDNPSCGITETLIHTGQHYDQNMRDVFFEEMGIPKPDVNLHAGLGRPERSVLFQETLYNHARYHGMGGTCRIGLEYSYRRR